MRYELFFHFHPDSNRSPNPGPRRHFVVSWNASTKPPARDSRQSAARQYPNLAFPAGQSASKPLRDSFTPAHNPTIFDASSALAPSDAGARVSGPWHPCALNLRAFRSLSRPPPAPVRRGLINSSAFLRNGPGDVRRFRGRPIAKVARRGPSNTKAGSFGACGRRESLIH